MATPIQKQGAMTWIILQPVGGWEVRLVLGRVLHKSFDGCENSKEGPWSTASECKWMENCKTCVMDFQERLDSRRVEAGRWLKRMLRHWISIDTWEYGNEAKKCSISRTF